MTDEKTQEIMKVLAIKVLGLKEDYKPEDVKKRYRELSLITHPDTNGDANLFMLVKDCYKYLYSESDSINLNDKDKDKNKEKSKSNKPEEKTKYYIELPRLYKEYYYLDRFKDISYIRSEIDLTIETSFINTFLRNIISSKRVKVNHIMDVDYSSYQRSKSVIFDIKIVLPEELEKYRYFKMRFNFLGKEYKKRLFRFKLKNSFKIKYKEQHFNSFVNIELLRRR